MHDEWDIRSRNEIQFESVSLFRDEIECRNFDLTSLYRKAISAYRQNVINLMEEYFEAANLHEILNYKRIMK